MRNNATDFDNIKPLGKQATIKKTKSKRQKGGRNTNLDNNNNNINYTNDYSNQPASF